jgi:two-component system LytT family response regulator
VLRVAICDDEGRALRRMKSLVEKCADVQLAGTFSNGRDFLDALNALKPNVAIIDLEMPGLSGFDAVRALADRDWATIAEPPLIILATVDPNFGIVAFDCGAVGILNKPVRLRRLQSCLERARIVMARHEARQRLDHLGAELEQVRELHRRAPGLRYIIVRRWGHKLTRVPLASIEWIEANHPSRVLLHCGSQVYRKSISLKAMAEDLAGVGFMRIHLSTLVNTRAIDRVESGAGVTAIWVRSGERLRVSRPYRPNAQPLKNRSVTQSQR